MYLCMYVCVCVILCIIGGAPSTCFAFCVTPVMYMWLKLIIIIIIIIIWPDHRLYTPYGCETAARANRFIMEYQCLYAGFAPLTFSFMNVSNSS